MSQGSRLAPAARLALLLIPAVLVLALAPAESRGGAPPLTTNNLGTRKAPLLLLSRPDVCADVGIDGTHAAEARRVLDALYSQAAALRGQKGPEALDRKRAIDEAQEAWLRAHLSEAQRKRLIEIDLQWEGPSALLSRPVVADHLGLTRDQRTQLGQAIAERDRCRKSGGDRRECENQLSRQALKILTPDQARLWKAMLGAPCEFKDDAPHRQAAR